MVKSGDPVTSIDAMLSDITSAKVMDYINFIAKNICIIVLFRRGQIQGKLIIIRLCNEVGAITIIEFPVRKPSREQKHICCMF